MNYRAALVGLLLAPTLQAAPTEEGRWASKLCAQAVEDEASFRRERELHGVVDPDYDPLLRIARDLCSMLKKRGVVPPAPPMPPPSPSPTGLST
jgi:hypothetical protein